MKLKYARRGQVGVVLLLLSGLLLLSSTLSQAQVPKHFSTDLLDIAGAIPPHAEPEIKQALNTLTTTHAFRLPLLTYYHGSIFAQTLPGNVRSFLKATDPALLLVVFTEPSNLNYHHCEVAVTEALQDQLSPQMAEHLMDQALRRSFEALPGQRVALRLGILEGLKAMDDYLSGLPAPDSVPTITFANPREATATLPAGLDAFQYEAHRANYVQLEINEAPYPVAWKALPSGQSSPVLAQVDEAMSFPPGVVFKQNDNVIPTQPAAQRHQRQVNLIGQGDEQEGSVAVYANDSEEAERVGQLNTVSYDVLPRKLVLVPLDGEYDHRELWPMLERVARIYQQAAVHLEVAIAEPVMMEDWERDHVLDDVTTGLLSNYTKEMRQVIRAFRRQQETDPETAYIFLDYQSKSGKRGYMPKKRQYGFVFNEPHRNYWELSTTIAHELGHGLFRLEHTFDTYPSLTQGSSRNLMDYGGGVKLRKYQWDLIHNPQAMLGWFQDEDENAYVSETQSEELARILNYIYCGTNSGETSLDVHHGWEVYEVDLGTLLNHLDFAESGNIATDAFQEAILRLGINDGTPPDRSKVFSGYQKATLDLTSYNYQPLEKLTIPTDQGNFFFSITNAFDPDTKAAAYRWLLQETGLNGTDAGNNYQVSSNFSYTADNVLLFSACQLSELSRTNRAELVEYLVGDLENILGLDKDTYQFLLLHILESIPPEDALYFYELFASNPVWVSRIYNQVSSDVRRDFVRVWFELWGSFYASNATTLSSSGKLILSRNVFGHADNVGGILDDGSVLFLAPYTHSQEVTEAARTVLAPFDPVYFYQPDQSAEKPFVTIPAVAAVLFLDSEQAKTWEDVGWTGLNVALYAVGIGEVYTGIRTAAIAWKAGGGLLSRQFLKGSTSAFLGASDIAASITSSYCGNHSGGFCGWWEQHRLYIELGLLTASVADIMYGKLSDAYAKEKLSFNTDQQRYLEDELGLVANRADEVVVGVDKFSSFNNLQKLPEEVLVKLGENRWSDDLLTKLDTDLADEKLLATFKNNPASVDAWKVLDDAGVSNAIRKNADHLEVFGKRDAEYPDVDFSKVNRILDNHPDPDDFIKNDLGGTIKGKDHLRTLVGDFENVPGVSSKKYVKNSLLKKNIQSPSEWSDPDLDLPDWASETFASSVTPKNLSEGTKIYRVIGDSQNPKGAFWTYELPKTKADLYGETAIRPEWNNGKWYVEYTVGKDGLKVWHGPTASQKVIDYYDDFSLLGGEIQIYIPDKIRAGFPDLSKNDMIWD